MGLPPVGAVVLINFPYADLKTFKKRPALIVAHSSLETVIMCQITSRRLPGVPSLAINKEDFKSGNLHATSYARPDKLFTVDVELINKQLGLLNERKLRAIRQGIRELF